MYPEIFSLGPFTIQGYGLMIFIGVMLAYAYMLANLKKHGLKSEDVSARSKRRCIRSPAQQIQLPKHCFPPAAETSS